MQGFTAQQQDEIRQIIREELKAALTITSSDMPRTILGNDIVISCQQAQKLRDKAIL